MAESIETYRNRPSTVRTLFCIGVRGPFFEAGAEERKLVLETCRSVFEDLGGRFGAHVLGTFDDDEIQVGPAEGFPWTAYILADVPDLAAAAAVCNEVRETEIGDFRMWRYLKIEARLGRPLFFGNG